MCALSASAADATGKWTGKDKNAEGKVVNLSFVFKQDGTTLAGALTLTDDSDQILETTNIENGKVDGDKISFRVSFSDGGTITQEGIIQADEITLTIRSGEGNSEISEIKLKRSN